jgi:hypothetical protein
MAITKEEVIDKIEILAESGNIQWRVAQVIKEDGVIISRKVVDRHVRTPLCDCTADDAQIRSVSGVIHTVEKKAQEQTRRDNL